jgi:uncharacterized membrane protein YcaP (DUF421 family)
MKKPNKQKKVTIDDLAISIDALAISVANGFSAVDKKFDEVGKEINWLKDAMKKTNQDVLNVGDKFVGRYEFDSLLGRVG